MSRYLPMLLFRAAASFWILAFVEGATVVVKFTLALPSGNFFAPAPVRAPPCLGFFFFITTNIYHQKRLLKINSKSL